MQYTIQQGRHHSWLPTLGLSTGELEFEVSFDESCLYKPLDWEHDYNKLVGFSCGFLPKKIDGEWEPHHHWNSFRICWRPYVNEQELAHLRRLMELGMSYDVALDYLPMPTEIELVGYFYENGVRRIEPLGRVVPGYVLTGKILANDIIGHMAIQLNTRWYYYEHTLPASFLGYKLGPYFGGTEPAPHRMSLRLS